MILTTGILEVCRGLKSEYDTEFGKKSHLWMDTLIGFVG